MFDFTQIVEFLRLYMQVALRCLPIMVSSIKWLAKYYFTFGQQMQLRAALFSYKQLAESGLKSVKCQIYVEAYFECIQLFDSPHSKR